MLKRNDVPDLCTVPDLSRKASNFSSVSMMLAVSFL